ncbi:MAG: MarR family transcriptional regulator [Dehalococcoidia bacterium]|nr:MarR family transcriptional regulator [Dehalococcoidia bacterium]
MVDELKSAWSGKAAGLIENFIKLHERFGSPSAEEVAEIEERTQSLVAGDEPDKIAGDLIFFRMSRLLYQSATLTMGELSEKLMIQKYTATRLVSWWVKKGFAERSGDPSDRRIVKVALTEKGRQFQEIIEDIVMRRVQHIMKRLTQDEQIIFFRLFEKLASQ